MVFEIINDIFVLLRDFLGTICVVGIVIFIILWFFGMKKMKYYSFKTGKEQESKKDKNNKIIDVEAEEKDTFEKSDKEI